MEVGNWVGPTDVLVGAPVVLSLASDCYTALLLPFAGAFAVVKRMHFAFGAVIPSFVLTGTLPTQALCKLRAPALRIGRIRITVGWFALRFCGSRCSQFMAFKR